MAVGDIQVRLYESNGKVYPDVSFPVYIFVHASDDETDFLALTSAARDPDQDTEWFVLSLDEAADLHRQLGELLSPESERE